MQAEAGDKVRIKQGTHAGERGLLEVVDSEKVVVRLEKSGLVVRLQAEQLTNFSLAARKAWLTEPNRAVGRRKGTKLSDRISVTLRFDRDVWERFRGMEDSGLIDDRTAAINQWLREKMDELERGERRS